MANTQNMPSIPNTQNTQNLPNIPNAPATQNITINNNTVRPKTTTPDETGYTMHTDTAAPDTWIYGNPELNYNGQVASEGVSLYTVSGTTPNTGASNTPMPIPGMNGETIAATHASSRAAQSQRMKNPLSMSATHTPANSEEAYQASLRSLLDRNVGYFIVASFLVGTQQTVTWQGILHTVGSDYMVLYQPDYERYISCDIYSLKFVQFHNVKGIPYCAASQNWQGHSSF